MFQILFEKNYNTHDVAVLAFIKDWTQRTISRRWTGLNSNHNKYAKETMEQADTGRPACLKHQQGQCADAGCWKRVE